MSEHTEISWTDATFNAWEGCTKVGPGCDNCYAEARNGRFNAGQNWGAGAPRLLRSESYWQQPVKWQRDAPKFHTLHNRRQRVFCSSLADVFDNEAPLLQRERLFGLIRLTPALDWLLLTKRIGNAKSMLPADWGTGYPNVWLGATVVNQEEADRDIPKLLAVPARVRFLSIEPMLGPINLAPAAGLPCQNAASIVMDPETGSEECCRRCDFTGISDEWGIDWVIAGGESGPKARPMHTDWVRSLRDQCAAAGVAFHFKQWGEWKPLGQMPHSEKVATDERHLRDDEYLRPDGNTHTTLRDDHEAFDAGDILIRRVGKKAAGRLLDGVTHDGFPA